LVVFAIEVWKTQTPFLVGHPWILDWLESIKTRNMALIPLEGPKRRTREGGSEWEPIKILFKNSAYEPNFTRIPPQASLAKPTEPLECYWT
jgi:hypothetical protein